MFKKVIVGLLAMLLLVSGSVSATRLEVVYEQDKIKSIVFPVGEARFFINDKAPGYTMDVKSFVVPRYNRTVVPVRFLANALGIADDYIAWVEAEQRVILAQPGMPRVEMVIGEKFMTIDGDRTDTFGAGEAATMDIAPLIRPVLDHPKGWGRTFLPARFVAYALGYQVVWCSELDLAIIWPKGDPEPDIEAVRGYLREERVELLGEAEQAQEEPEQEVAEGYFEHYGFTIPVERYDLCSHTTLIINTRKVGESPSNRILFMRIFYAAPNREEQLEQMRQTMASKFGEAKATEWINHLSTKIVEWINIERQTHHVDGYKIVLGGTFQSIGIHVHKTGE